MSLNDYEEHPANASRLVLWYDELRLAVRKYIKYVVTLLISGIGITLFAFYSPGNRSIVYMTTAITWLILVSSLSLIRRLNFIAKDILSASILSKHNGMDLASKRIAAEEPPSADKKKCGTDSTPKCTTHHGS